MKCYEFLEDVAYEEDGVEVVTITDAHEAIKLAVLEFIDTIDNIDSYPHVVAICRDKRNYLKSKKFKDAS